MPILIIWTIVNLVSALVVEVVRGIFEGLQIYTAAITVICIIGTCECPLEISFFCSTGDYEIIGQSNKSLSIEKALPRASFIFKCAPPGLYVDEPLSVKI